MPIVPEIRCSSGGAELLASLAPLWLELRDHHSRICTEFSGEIAARTFEQRLVDWNARAQRGALHVDLAFIGGENFAPIGYCVTTIDSANIGEVDSLFVREELRRQGVGGVLVQRALAWLDGRGVRSRIVEIVAGNETAIGFYARFGFRPRRTVMKQVITT